MIKKIISIVLPIIAVTAAIFVFGLKVYQSSFDNFKYDGFVIGTSSGKESAKYHFSKDEKYKVNDTKGEVEFTNSEDEDVTVPDASFVHYTDGSISTFKKAVVLNLANVKTDSLQYYNVFNGSIFTKTGDGYQIQYLEQTLSFNDFLVKISDTKYMIVGKNLSIKYGEKEETIADGFLEINYLDGNIIRIENQDLLLQNISTDISIEVDGIKTDLLNKKIIYNEETKVDLGEITIDSDDNIEIIPDETNTDIIDQEEKNEISNIENQPVVAPGVDVSGMESGVIDTSVEKVEQIVNTNKKIKDAEFKIESFEVKTNLMTATISIQDDEGVLKGDVVIKVIDTATNEEHCKRVYGYGDQPGSYSCATLSPGRNYLLIANSKYQKKEVNYEKDFIQRTFMTPTAGISIEKDYVATDEISFKVKIKEDSNVSKFDYILIDSEQGEKSTPIASGTFDRYKEYDPNKTVMCGNETISGTTGGEPESAGSDSANAAEAGDEENGDAGGSTGDGDEAQHKINECTVTIKASEYPSIKSNKKYSLIIKNVYDSNVTIANYKVYKTEATLKEKPKFDGTTAIVNKLSSKFVIYLNNLKDINNSVVSYKADILHATTGQYIATYEAGTSNQIEIAVGTANKNNNEDGVGVIRGESYKANIYIKYYDNEKEYEQYIGQELIGMDSAQAPIVDIKPTIIAQDRIKGNIKIEDEGTTILEGTKITITATNQSDGKKTSTAAIYTEKDKNLKYITIPIDFSGLKSNTTYLFEVIATINLGDQVGNDANTTTVIGSRTVTTIAPANMKAYWEVNNKSKPEDGSFSINFVLSEALGDENKSLTRRYQKSEDELKLLSTEERQEYDNLMAEIKDYEINALQNIVFRIHKVGATIRDNSDCTADKQCWMLKYNDPKQDDEYIIKNLLYIDREELGTDSDGNATSYKIKFTPKNNTNQANAMFPIGPNDMQFATYIIQAIQATDFTEYQNAYKIANDYVTFTPNDGKTEPILDDEYFTESAVFETTMFPEEGQDVKSSLQEGFTIIPKINNEAVSKIVEKNTNLPAKLDFEYILIDLKNNIPTNLSQIDKQANLLKYHADGSYGISFTKNDFNEWRNKDTTPAMARGTAYGFCFNITVYHDVDGDNKYTEGTDRLAKDENNNLYSYSCDQSDRAIKQKFQMKKRAPEVNAWLKKTDYVAPDTKLTYKYTIYDPDKAIHSRQNENGEYVGKVIEYKISSSDSFSLASCINVAGETVQKDCLSTSVNPNKEFFINIRTGGSLVGNIGYRTLDEVSSDITPGSALYIDPIYETQNFIADRPVSAVVDPLAQYDIDYKILQQEEGAITTKFEFSGAFQGQRLKDYVVGVRMHFYTLKRGNSEINKDTETLLYKEFDNYDFVNDSDKYPTVTVNNSELVKLQEQDNVIIEIHLLYNRNFYGFEQNSSENDLFSILKRSATSSSYTIANFEDYSNSKLEGSKIFSSVVAENSSTGDIEIIPSLLDKGTAESRKTTLDIHYNKYGKYYYDKNSKSNYVQIAKLYKYKTECADINLCQLNVKLTNPVFLMEENDMKPLIGGTEYKFTLLTKE